jgi:hypothetical protein
MKYGRARHRSRIARNRPRRKGATPRYRRLWFEWLEERRVLATLTVNSLADVVNGSDLVVTLREAIIAANTDTATELGETGNGADEIVFAASLFEGGPATIMLTQGELLITSDLSILGEGADQLTIDASLNDETPTSTLSDGNNTNDGDGSRVFNIDNSEASVDIEVTLTGLALTGADSPGSGGAIRSAESLIVNELDIFDNMAFMSGGSAPGGGIYFSSAIGSLEIVDTRISGNAARGGGGVYASAIAGEISIEGATIENNNSRVQGGGLNISGLSTIVDTSIRGNTANANGGGIFHSGGTLNVSTSTISGNSTTSIGGGICAIGDGLVVTSSTISGNSASSSGGGIFANAGSTSRIAFSTITKNTTGVVGAGIRAVANTVLDHTIAAGNLFSTGGPPTPFSDVSGQITARYSLIGDGSGAAITDNGGNFIGSAEVPINAFLGSLTSNGGRTQTHLLLPESPAIDAGDPTAQAGVSVPTFDQRGEGFPRVVGRVDIGAIELANSAPVLTVPGPQRIDEGGFLDLQPIVSFTDVNGSDTYTVEVTWGDGQVTTLPNVSLGVIPVVHHYADNGVYTVEITVDDNLGGTDSESFLLTVDNVLPTLVVPGIQSIAEDVELSIANIGVITDPGFRRDPTNETFRFWIDWDDDSSADVGNAVIDDEGGAVDLTDASFDGAHTYGTNGTYTVRVRVADDDMSGDFVGGVPGTDFVEGTFTVQVGASSATLSNAPGAGTISVTVDGYGTFQTGIFDPTGPLDAEETTYLSDIAVRIAGFSGNGFPGESGGSSPPTVLDDGTQVTSSFDFGVLHFELTQRLEPITLGGVMIGTRLIQTYVVTKTSEDPVNFELIRYFDGDLEFGDLGPSDDYGGFEVRNGEQTLFETDTVGGQIDLGTFVGIAATGGDTGGPNRFQIGQYSELRSLIRDGGALDNTVINDSDDEDLLTDITGTDIALAFRNLFTLNGSESVQYETSTIFRSFAPPTLDLNGAAAGSDLSLSAERGDVVAIGSVGPADITDADSATLTEIVARVTQPPAGVVGVLRVDAAVAETTGIEVDSSSGTLTLRAGESDGSIAAFETVLRTLTFEITTEDSELSSITIEVAVLDELGLTGTALVDIALNDEPPNQSPIITVPAPQTLQAGGQMTLDSLVSFDDPDESDTHRVTVDWGDGTPLLDTLNAPVGAILGSHQYATSGTFTVRVTVSDNFGGSDTKSFTVTVDPLPPDEEEQVEDTLDPQTAEEEIDATTPPSDSSPRPVFVNTIRFPVSDGGSGGQVLDAPNQFDPPPASALGRELALDNALSQRGIEADAIVDAVYELAEIELVTLVGHDMGDEPLPKKKKEGDEEEAKDAAESQQAETSEHRVEKPVTPDNSSWEPLLWSALAGGGTLWLGGAWWWRGHRRQRRFSGEITG